VSADAIEANDLAWYECRKCGGAMTNADKGAMLSRGQWIAENPNVTAHRGFHLSTLYSPLVRWSTYAAEFLRSKDRPELLMNFTNSWEGEDWVEKALPVTEASVGALAISYPMGVVPLAAQLVTCGVDVQNEYVKYVVRAWGPDDESWLIDYGLFLRTKDAAGKFKDDDLDKLGAELLPTQYEHANGSRAQIALCYIDSGYRTDTVYKFAAKHRHMVTAVKGANEKQIDGEDMGKLIPQRRVRVERLGNFYYTRLNTTYYKDMLQGQRENARKPWHIPEGVDATYLREVSAEHKRIERDSKGRGVHVWALREGFTDNHYFDCEVYALAAADEKGLRKLAGAGERKPEPRRAAIRMPDGRPFFVGNR
jgi:phage terminase large subunit GpA-like protein